MGYPGLIRRLAAAGQPRQTREDLRKLRVDGVEPAVVAAEASVDGVESRVVAAEASIDGVESRVVGGEASVDLVETAVVRDNLGPQIQDHVTDDLDIFLQAVDPGVCVWHVINVATATDSLGRHRVGLSV